MPEGLQTPEGTPVDVEAAKAEADKAFARAAVNAKLPDDEPAPPPKREREAVVNEEKPKRRGRPPKHERPRVAPAPAKASPETDKRREEGVKGLVQIGAGVCLMLDQRTPEKDISFRADAVTLANSADAIANACVETAKANAQFAAVLDKITNVGPYAALMTVVFQVGGQIARNHGVVAAEAVGAIPPEKLLGQLEESPDGDQAAA